MAVNAGFQYFDAAASAASRHDETGPSGIQSAASGHSTAAGLVKSALVVEDEIFVALHLESVLQGLGFKVSDIVATGREAVEAVEAAPDIVFMDINLRKDGSSDFDGIESARRIRELTDIPIVFVTAYSDEATYKRIAETVPGAPVLQKPPSVSMLETAIRKVMAGRGSMRA